MNKDLLFVGTEFGLFFTVDGGRHWVQLRNGAPTVTFRDLEIQRRENDLVAATFGRGFYVLDDYTALRYLTSETLAHEGSLFPPRDAHVYNELGYVAAVFGNFTTPNPPFGAMLTYYLREGLPQGDGYRIVLTITDAKGESIRQITGPTTAGLHRVVWNLRGAPQSVEEEHDRGNQRASRDRRRGRQSDPLVKPGKYTITLTKVVDGEETVLGEPQTIEVKPLSRWVQARSRGASKAGRVLLESGTGTINP